MTEAMTEAMTRQGASAVFPLLCPHLGQELFMLNPLTRWFRAPPEAKASRAQSAVAFYFDGRAVWTPRDYAALAREGFQRNAIVHRAVRLVAEAAASLPLTLKQEGRDLAMHPLLSLLSRPNPREGGQRFL